ncbi:MAG: copper-translocating P-type ATPase [Methanosphaera sp. rholeuAM270]|nr:MAG: copper-translocating P-type ATPase [Methanosphaera sp. rholeuAM270]
MKELIEMINKIIKFKKEIITIIISITALIASFMGIRIHSIDPNWIAIIICGIPLIIEAFKELIYNHNIKADILVAIAIIASIIIGETFAAAEIAIIMQIGGLLEQITVSTTQLRIEKLIELQPPTARKIENRKETIINSLEIKKGDTIKVLPGETIPADGTITEGHSTINQAILTGESKLIDKTINDEVYAGTINSHGTLTIKVTKNGENNSLQKLIKMIEEVNKEDTPIIRQADKWANYVVALSFITAIFTIIYTKDIIKAVTVLVVFCPCALILATPTAIIASIGNLSKNGILVKNSSVLESMHQSDTIIFDKTGTLTTGIPKVVSAYTINGEENEFLKLTASIESNSEHPLAKAMVDYYNSSDYYEITDTQTILGMGIKGYHNGKLVLVGNGKLFDNYNIELPEVNPEKRVNSSTEIYTYHDNKFLGITSIKDTPRKGIKHTISLLKEKYRTILLTGDNEEVARDIANQLNINEVHPNCLPEHKLDYVRKEQSRNNEVIMIGDGINDASALKKANVGIAMGDVGSDITIDSSDLVFMNGKLEYLPYALDISQKTIQTINIGITFSLALNTIAMIMGIMGVLTPITGALVHNIGSVLVITFAALLFKQKNNYAVKT